MEKMCTVNRFIIFGSSYSSPTSRLWIFCIRYKSVLVLTDWNQNWLTQWLCQANAVESKQRSGPTMLSWTLSLDRGLTGGKVPQIPQNYIKTLVSTSLRVRSVSGRKRWRWTFQPTARERRNSRRSRIKIDNKVDNKIHLSEVIFFSHY